MCDEKERKKERKKEERKKKKNKTDIFTDDFVTLRNASGTLGALSTLE